MPKCDSLFYLVDGHINLKSHDLAQGILGELLGADAEKTDLLIGNGGLVVAVDVLLEVGVKILNLIRFEIVLVGVDLGNDGVV